MFHSRMQYRIYMTRKTGGQSCNDAPENPLDVNIRKLLHSTLCAKKRMVEHMYLAVKMAFIRGLGVPSQTVLSSQF